MDDSQWLECVSEARFVAAILGRFAAADQRHPVGILTNVLGRQTISVLADRIFGLRATQLCVTVHSPKCTLTSENTTL